MLLLRQNTRHGKREEGREQSLLEPVLRKWAEVDEPAEERLNIIKVGNEPQEEDVKETERGRGFKNRGEGHRFWNHTDPSMNPV